MRFSSLNATFGKLEQRSVRFAEGLNIIEAPNEAGKSTLCAFLRVMLYGLPTRERGASADKNLYAPWSGSPMQGRLELVTDDGTGITLTRDTARANAPMGRFSAVYTGTGETVDALTAADCGEQLLGVPREVYERSAFIRQSGLAVSADAELERRIAALITTGEETTSYSEAEASLRRQLNARRHNKTGRLPALEAEIAALQSSADELRALAAEHREAEAALEEHAVRADTLRADLARHELADAQERQKARADAERAAQSAETQSAQFAALLREEKLPSREALMLAQAKLPSIRALEQRARESAQRSAEARAALDAFDAAAQTGGGTQLYIAAAFLFAVMLALWLAPLSAGSLRYAAPLLSLAAVFFAAKGRRAQGKRKARADARGSLERTAQEADAAADAQQKLYEDAVRELLSVLPIDTLAQADRYLDTALTRWERLAALESDARTARARCEALAAQGGESEVPTEAVERPAVSRSALLAALGECEAAVREAQRRIDYTDGRSRALGDLADTESTLAEKRAEHAVLSEEYDALVLAMDALAQANTTLQNRFSPALGQRAAELLCRMTDGRYRAVLLDRSFNASVEAAGDPIARDLLSLSQGAADQLYLAVRLAVCELVLPEGKSVPLVLDDALTNFDDARCAAALELLAEEGKKRQILLLTCQHREAEYLAGREGVHVMTL